MSADNGIYILKTKEGQNRVIHSQAIENLYWDERVGKDVVELSSKQVVRFFGKAKYTYNIDKARDIAIKMYEKIPYVEHGIQEIFSYKTWDQIIKEANQ